MARSTRVVILTLWDRKRFLLPVTYFPTNLVYPFILRVTGITRSKVIVEGLSCPLPVTLFFKFHIKILLERTKLPTSAPRHLADGSGTSDHVNACLTDLLILMWFSELRCYAGMDQWNPFQKHIYKFGFLVPVTYLTTNTIYLLLYE